MKEPRRTPVKVWLTATERRRLSRLTRGRALSPYIREMILGAGANAEKDADDWWASLSQGRREQIHRWVATDSGSHVRQEPLGEPLPLVFEDATQG